MVRLQYSMNLFLAALDLLKKLAEVLQNQYNLSAEDSKEAANNLVALFEVLYGIKQKQLQEGVDS